MSGAARVCGGGDWPDLGLDVPCCSGSALMGPENCTCWKPIYEPAEQAPPCTDTQFSVMPAMCPTCAFRPDSPERTGHPKAAYGQADLDDLVVRGAAFWCHDGLRAVAKWVHPSGAERLPEVSSYTPPMLKGVPYRADGSPGDLCAGWAARRAHEYHPRAPETR